MTIVIIGSGLAGYLLVKGLRDRGCLDQLIVITKTDGVFYSKPMLSNAFTQGKTANDLVTMTAGDMTAKYDFTLLHHRSVVSLDRQQQCVILDDGQMVSFDQCVLACGAEPITLGLQGNAADDVVQINHLHDYRHFRDKLCPGQAITILGGGLVGCEFAADLVNADYVVQVVHEQETPVSRLLPFEVGEVLRDQLAHCGVRWFCGRLAQKVDRQGQGYRVCLDDAQVLESDLVLSAVGLRPNIQLAVEAGLAVNFGIVVDRFCQTTDHRIFALGDCAEVAGLSMCYVAPIRCCIAALTQTLLGKPTAVVYPVMPVVLKTTPARVIVSPPPEGRVGAWHYEGQAPDIEGVFRDESGHELGFVLSGSKVAKRAVMMKRMPAVLYD